MIISRVSEESHLNWSSTQESLGNDDVLQNEITESKACSLGASIDLSSLVYPAGFHVRFLYHEYMEYFYPGLLPFLFGWDFDSYANQH